MIEGTRIRHKKYGLGTVILVERKNGYRHKTTPNVGIIFDHGGPQGWAENSSHNLKELEKVEVS